MSITQDVAAVVTAANNLTQQVSDKITSIDQRVGTFETEAKNIANNAVKDMYRSRIGFNGLTRHQIKPTPEDDTGLLVQQAFDAGHKCVEVHWDADGQERHWNSIVDMPIGATIYIAGPPSGVEVLGGNVRSDRACYNFGRRQGTSDLGSPMIFRNLQQSSLTYPYSDYLKVWDSSSLINLHGNNVILWGDGTYLHDQGGMCATADGNGLVRLAAYGYDTKCWVGGGGHHCQFYLSGPLLNNSGGTSTCEVRFMSVYFTKVTSDGPVLTADKGYRRLLDKGVPGVTSALLNKQPYEYTDAECGYNDNVHTNVHLTWINALRGVDTESDRPRLIGTTTWAHPGGWTLCQFWGGEGQCSLAGLEKIGTTETWIGSR